MGVILGLYWGYIRAEPSVLSEGLDLLVGADKGLARAFWPFNSEAIHPEA